MMQVAISGCENKLSDDIFERLKSLPIIDKYIAYQLLDDKWIKIANDLEVIQTEGFESTKKVDPNFVTKTKTGENQEVQDGWIGRIIPFELVQKTILKSEFESLKKSETSLAQIPSEYEEIIDSMTEEERDSDALNESKDAFNAKEIPGILKGLKSDKSPEAVAFREKLERVTHLLKEERDLRSKIRKDAVTLHLLTKETIENLKDDEVNELLEMKWIISLIDDIAELPNGIINKLISKIEILNSKYKTTYFELEEKIKESERLICSMIDELDGNEFDMKGLCEFKSLLTGE